MAGYWQARLGILSSFSSTCCQFLCLSSIFSYLLVSYSIRSSASLLRSFCQALIVTPDRVVAMAISGSIEACVRVADVSGKEYLDDEVSDTQHLITRYIEATPGAEFIVYFVVKPTYSFDSGCLVFELSLDGHTCDPRIMHAVEFKANQKRGASTSSCFWSIWKGHVRYNFVFRSLGTFPWNLPSRSFLSPIAKSCRR